MDNSIEKYMLKCESGYGDVTAMIRIIDTDSENINDVVEIIAEFLEAVGYCDESIKRAFYGYSNE